MFMSAQPLFIFPTGDSQVDAQHDELDTCIERLFAAKTVMTSTLCAMSLYQRVREHFFCEAKLMRKHSYPAIEAHLYHHEELISQLNAVARNMAIEPWNKAGLELFIAELTHDHIGTHDKQLAVFLSQEAASPQSKSK